MRAIRFVLPILLLSLIPSTLAFGQAATGLPTYGSFSGSSFDTVNNANLNVYFAIPIVSKEGRGIPFNYLLGYNSLVWTPVSAGGSSSWTPVTGWGWQGITSAYAGYTTNNWQQGSCYFGTQWEYYDIYANWAYYDTSGTLHRFNLTTSDAQDVAPDCLQVSQPPPYNATGTATDGSGYTMRAGGGGAFVDSPSGWEFSPPTGTPSGTAAVVDNNGNEVSIYLAAGTTTFTDTLGTTGLKVTGSGTASSPVVYKYYSEGDIQQTVTVNYVQKTVETHFGCSNITDYGRSTQKLQYLVNSIVFPDGSTYSVKYEATLSPNHAGAVTGRISEIDLPTGGKITYAYSGGSGSPTTNAINCADGSVATLTRTLDPGGQWTYTRSQISGAHWQTTVQDPATNSTTIDLQGLYETERDVAGLETIYTCYNGASYPCNTTAVSLPITRRTVTTNLGGQTSQVDTHYSTVGLPTEVDEYDYGSSGPGSLLRKTETSYDALSGYSTFYRPATVSVYDGSSNLVAQTSYGYDETGVTSTSGTPQHYSVYGARGNLTSVTSDGLTSHYTYYDTGMVATAKDPNGNQATFNSGTGACGNAFPTTIGLPMSLSISESWDCYAALPTSVTDANGKATSFSYDSMNRLTGTSYPDGGSVTVSYSPTEIDTTTAIASGVTGSGTTIMDGLGRVTSQTARGVTTTTTYSLGRVASVSVGSASDTYAYDALNRVTGVTHADNNSVGTSYSGNCTIITDEADNTKTLCTDGLGRLISVKDALGNTTTYAYDALNDLTSVTQGSQTRTYQYDSLGRLTSAITPESGTTSYTYDTDSTCGTSDGDLVKRVDARGDTTCYAYDALHRLTAKSYPNSSTPTANYYYGQGSVTIGSWSSGTLSNPLGRLTEATTTASGSVQTALVYGYDPMGRVSNFWQCSPYNCGSSAWQMTYNYDLAGDVASYTHPAGFTITNQIDKYQRITQITSSLNDSTHPGTLASMTYNSWGGLATLTNGCAGSGCVQTQETYDYNDRLQPVRIELGTNSSASADSCLVYNYYQGAPQPASCTSTPTQASSGDNGAVAGYWYEDNVNTGLSHTAAFSYDGVNRLTQATATGNSTYSLPFVYDQYGNMTCNPAGNPNGPCPDVTYYSSNNHINQIGGTSAGYDAAGNLTSDDSYTYHYDAEDRLVQVTQGSTTLSTNTYNALGLLARRVIPNSWIDLPHDASGRTIGFYNDGGQSWWERRFWGGGQLLGQYDAGTTYFIHQNDVGSTSPTQITDASGGLSGDETYYPWGQKWQYDNVTNAYWQFYGSISRFQYDLGLYATPNRFYRPFLGRWLTPDKLGGDVTDPQSLNRYAYVLNNPATLNDPSGLQPDGGYCDPFDPEGCPPPSCGGDLNLTPCPPVYCGPLDPEACSPLCYYLGNCWGYGNGYGTGGAEGTSIPPPTAAPAGQPPLGGEGLGFLSGADVQGPIILNWPWIVRITAWGLPEIAEAAADGGAAALAWPGIAATVLMQKGDAVPHSQPTENPASESENARAAERQFDRDMATCRRLKDPAARSRCYESALNRKIRREQGWDPLPPLITW